MKKAIVLTGIIILVLALTVSARGYGRGRGNSSQSFLGAGLRDGSCLTTTDSDFTPDFGLGQGQGQRKGLGNGSGNRQGNENGNGNAQGQGNGIRRQSRLFYTDDKIKTASIAKYDADKNGTLDVAELSIMREEHNKLKDQYDIDGDGRLSDEEFEDYKDALYKELGIE